MKKKLPLLLKEIKSKQLPTIDYATQKSISYSQLSMFNECPKKWSLQYKEGYKQLRKKDRKKERCIKIMKRKEV